MEASDWQARKEQAEAERLAKYRADQTETAKHLRLSFLWENCAPRFSRLNTNEAQADTLAAFLAEFCEAVKECGKEPNLRTRETGVESVDAAISLVRAALDEPHHVIAARACAMLSANDTAVRLIGGEDIFRLVYWDNWDARATQEKFAPRPVLAAEVRPDAPQVEMPAAKKTKKKCSKPRKPAVKLAVALLKKGLDRSAIAERVGCDVDYVTTIRGRYAHLLEKTDTT